MIKDWLDVLIFCAFVGAIIVLFILLGGCTATSLQQQEAEVSAIQGTYINGFKCTRMSVATGKAAVAAARYSEARQVEVRR